MSDSQPVPTEPEGFIPSLIERFNSGKVSDDGIACAGLRVHHERRTNHSAHAKIAVRLERDLRLGLPLVAKVRHVFVADDIAQVVVDWSIDGMGPYGEQVHLGGSASDIVRRGADGRWRYLIDTRDSNATALPDRCAPRPLRRPPCAEDRFANTGISIVSAVGQSNASSGARDE